MDANSPTTASTEKTDRTFRAEISLYYDVYIPPGIKTPAPLLIAVHGYGAHKRYMMREAKAVANDKFVIASVQAPHQHFRQTEDGYRIGFGWLTEHKPEEYIQLHHRFLLHVIDELAAERVIDARSVFLYGFSQACALNFRFAFTYPDAVSGVIGVCGGVPGDLETNPVYQPLTAPTLYLHGDDDEFYTQEKFADFVEKLSSRLPNFASKQYQAKHEITEEMRADIRAFLEECAMKQGIEH